MGKIPYQYFFPLLLPLQKNKEETIDEKLHKWARMKEIPKSDQDKLISEKIAQKILAIVESFSLSLEQGQDISRAILKYYFQELKQEGFPSYLAREISVNLEKATEITKMVFREIIDADLSEEKAYQQSLVSMPLQQALQEIPAVGEQAITSERIHLAGFPEEVRPSIKNWISDYTSLFGYEKIDPVAMGNYLFHSENTKKLNSADRQKLTYILKALNDGMPVSINKTLKQIIFQDTNTKIQTSNNLQDTRNKIQAPNFLQNTNTKAQTPKTNISFSSPQKLPYESESQIQKKSFFPAQKAPNNLPTIQRQNTIVLQKKPEPPRPMNKNVVNLRTTD